MSTSSTSINATPTAPAGNGDSSDSASAGELVARLSTQLTTLVRDEMRLAQAELAQKGKKAGLGAGLFGGAGAVALYGVGALVACAILGLASVMDAWLAALIVGVVLLVLAGILALVGKKEVAQAGSPVPQEAVAGLKKDVATVKESAKR